VDAPEEILSRWTWRLARATRKLQDRRAGSDLPEAKRLLGALTNSRGHRHEENAARLVNVALEQPIHVAVALLASAEAYTPTAQQLVDRMRERLGTIQEVANALADNLPAPKQHSGKSRRRRRKRKQKAEQQKAQQQRAEKDKAPNAKGTERKPEEEEEEKKAEKPKPSAEPAAAAVPTD
jgi:outer membrane biosynthesis protein TonB